MELGRASIKSELFCNLNYFWGRSSPTTHRLETVSQFVHRFSSSRKFNCSPMPISSFSVLRLRPSSLLLFGRPSSRLPAYLTAVVARKSQASVSRRSPPSKNLLKAKNTASKYLSTLTPAIAPDEAPELTPSQAVGMVAASQANFMRVIVQSVPEELVSRTAEEGAGSIEEVSSALVGTELLCVVRAVLKKIKRRVLVGDKVVVGAIDWVDKRGMIENVFQRKSEILDPPVANVDHLLVLFSVDQPKLEPFTLTRFLVEAESTGMPLTLALNKCELADEETLEAWKIRLRDWGYDPLFCSVESKQGLDTLKFTLRDQTTVIVGPSGVGKSSLINALRNTHGVLNATNAENWLDHMMKGNKWFEDQRIGEVSSRSGRGKHTTRHVSLLPISEGGFVADTPGFNQPSLLKVTKQSLASTFPEIRKMIDASQSGKCSFSNCLHLGELGCVVDPKWERYPYYLQLLDEIRIREEFQLRTFGTKREGDVRYKMGEMGVQQAEPRLELKKHRRQSRKRINQSIMEDLDDDDDDVDESIA
uniref:Uncharacterized protein n=1 Tax=Kalanchoe fedtschenkoi TaxID=63787 RepID=A0A7N0VJ60_KALFE